MAQLLSTKTVSIYFNSKRLTIELEYYKTVVRIYFIDDTQSFPLLDEIRVHRTNKLDYSLFARDYAINHNLFK